MRAFIAIALPKEIQEKLALLQNKLRKTGADVKWVSPANIHLTLKFLGEIDIEQLSQISGILESVAKDHSTFLMRLGQVGAFPRPDSPRVIWIGLDHGDKETETIAEELEEKIEKLGIPKEDRPFSSHITIGRTRSTLNRLNLVRELKNSRDPLGIGITEFTAEKITLFKSVLSPKGPTYEALKEAVLKTT